MGNTISEYLTEPAKPIYSPYIKQQSSGFRSTPNGFSIEKSVHTSVEEPFEVIEPDNARRRFSLHDEKIKIPETSEINGIKDYERKKVPADEKDRRNNHIVIKTEETRVTSTIKQTEEESMVVSAEIYCSSYDNVLVSEVNLQSFESIHGVSRIVKLIPDKLATALAINKEHLSDPKDDGSFLVNLVLKLISFYLEQIDNYWKNRKISDTDVSLLEKSDKLTKEYNFRDILKQLFVELNSFNDQLQIRNEGEIKEQAQRVLRLADIIQIFSQVYLDIVHPTLIQMKRKGDANVVDEINMKKQKLEDKLIQNRSQPLLEEFHSCLE